MLNLLGRGGRVSMDVDLAGFLTDYSIEVTPRTAAKVPDFAALLPAGTRVYIAHIDGTPIDQMVATARRLGEEGYEAMPHIPARMVETAPALEDWVGRYREEAGVRQALLLAGGLAMPRGPFASSIDLMETGVFERMGFHRLHVAGHPEGNREIAPDGSTAVLDEAIAWKQSFHRRTGIDMAIVTQFAFEAGPVIAWAERLRRNGIELPIHAGVAGPARLQTLIKYGLACGVGPSMRVLQRRAMDLSRLMLPYEPGEVLHDLAAYRALHPGGLIERVHFFPLGGIAASAQWANAQSQAVRAA